MDRRLFNRAPCRWSRLARRWTKPAVTKSAVFFTARAAKHPRMTNRLLIFAALAALSACTTVRAPPQTAAGPDFLVRNAAAKHVVRTASGLEYFIVKSGDRKGVHPAKGDTVSFDYEGKLLNGETFDSSIERGTPLSGEVGHFVPGFDEALMLMRPGDEWVVWIPPELGYKDRAVGPIPPNSILRFRLILHSVTPAPAASQTPA